MAMTHSAAALQAATDAVVDLIDGGAGAGTLEILDGATVLAILTMSDPAFGAAAASGLATASAITDDASANADGTADGWRCKDSNGNIVMTGEARASGDADLGEELVLDNTSITRGQTVSISSFTYKALTT